MLVDSVKVCYTKSMALYHTYRPKTFADMEETQPDVARFFSKALENDQLGHIYLMVGSHGIGKTSTARILARAVNCLAKSQIVDRRSQNDKEDLRSEISDLRSAIPCNECENCRAILDGSFVDVYELDAASNRGIDDVRALQEVIRLSPVMGRKKVYIIDEVHMLTTEAFNALLKTFEEPPAQRLFLLCTTELHKVPQTIQSRAQIIRLAKPSDEIIAKYVTKVVMSEGGTIDSPAALALAQAADGAFRDAAKLVEQLFIHSKDISLELVSSSFVGSNVAPDLFVRRLRDGASAELQQDLLMLEQSGSNVSYFIRACIAHVRESIRRAVQQGTLMQRDIALLRSLQQALSESRYAPIAVLPLELAVYEYLEQGKGQKVKDKKVEEIQPPQEAVTRKGNEEPREQKLLEASAEKDHAKGEMEVVTVAKSVTPKRQEPVMRVAHAALDTTTMVDVVIEATAPFVDKALPPEFERIRERWKEVVALVKDSNASVASVLKISPPQLVDGNSLILSTTYKFHKDRLESQKNRQLVEGALFELFGVQMKVNCQLVQQTVRKKDVENVQSVSDEGLVEAAMEIFAS